MRFSVFAMGDRHYWPRPEDKHLFCKAGKDLDAKLVELGAELDEIRPGSFEPRVVEELVTRLLCRIDAVDTGGDAELRGIRRDLVRRAEARSAAP